jgi:hypothetical protein
MKESEIDQALRKHAEARGVLYLKMNIDGRRGYPDRMLLIPRAPYGGIAVFIELKRTGERPRKQQFHKIEKLKRMGFDVVAIDDVEDGKRVIDEFTGLLE